MKICYIILTCEKFMNTRALWQNRTFLQKVDKKDVYFISCKKSGENVYGWDTSDDYHSCPTKYIKFFKHMEIDYDWYVFIDDDTYMYTKRLHEFLQSFDSKQLLYIGSKRLDNWQIPFMSGGAGFCLSKELYKRVTQYVVTKSDRELYFCYNGDVTIGSWISNISNVIHIDEARFFANKHNSEDQLTTFISFHYLKSKEEFDFYHKYNI